MSGLAASHCQGHLVTGLCQTALLVWSGGVSPHPHSHSVSSSVQISLEAGSVHHHPAADREASPEQIRKVRPGQHGGHRVAAVVRQYWAVTLLARWQVVEGRSEQVIPRGWV